jgi:hypothetical protein
MSSILHSDSSSVHGCEAVPTYQCLIPRDPSAIGMEHWAVQVEAVARTLSDYCLRHATNPFNSSDDRLS